MHRSREFVSYDAVLLLGIAVAPTRGPVTLVFGRFACRRIPVGIGENLRKYEVPKELSKEDVGSAIERDNSDELATIPISVSLYATDLAWASETCVRLASHAQPGVRGNAVLGFGHLARRFGRLDLVQVLPIVERSLQDSDPYVRGHAWSAADDLEQFLGCCIRRPVEPGSQA